MIKIIKFAAYSIPAVLIMLPAVLSGGCGDSVKRPFTVTSYGGDYQDIIKEAMIGPFAAETGIRITDAVYDGRYDSLHRDALAPRSSWDVVDVEANMLLLGKSDGLLEPIDYSIVDVEGLNPAAKLKYGVGNFAWSSVLAYNEEVFSENPPETWNDFFDIDAYPGSRCLRKDPRRTLEIALLADGVPPVGLYPLDADRALKKLDGLIDDLDTAGYELLWWEDFADPGRLLSEKKAVMSSAANGRIEAEIKKGGPLAFSWKGGILELDYWVVPANSPRKRQAMKFLKYCSTPEAQSKVAKDFYYGPSNDDAFEMLPENIRVQLPTHPDNLKEQVFFDAEWWHWYNDEITVKWNNWLVKQGL